VDIKKNSAGFVILGILALVTYLVVDRYVIHKNMKRYPDFGIQIPMGYNVHGIDVSKYQKDINWQLVSQMQDQGAKIQFAIVKATEGASMTDRFCQENLEGAREHGLIAGAYLYFHPKQNGVVQAKHFIKYAKLKDGDLAPVIDIEESNGASKTMVQKNLQDCINALKEEYKSDPIIYSGAKFYEQYLSEICNDLPLWVAHYYESKPEIKRDFDLWQHNDRGTVNGIDAKVDFNVVNGSYRDLLGLCL
jgi:lysozyme